MVFRRSVQVALVLLGVSTTASLGALKPPVDPLRSGLSRLSSCLYGHSRCTWEKTYGGALEDKAYGVAALPDGGAVIGGHSRSRVGFTYSAWILRLSRSGRVMWEKRVEGGTHDRVFGITALPDGELVAAGRTRPHANREHDAWVFRMSSAGALLWQRTLGGNHDDRARSVAGTRDGAAILGGYRTPEGDDTEGWMVRVEADGAVGWEWSGGGPGNQGIFNVAVEHNGSVIGAGYTASEQTGGYSLWVVKLSDDGKLLWEKTYRRSVFSAGAAVTVAGDGRVVVAGQSGATLADSDVWVLALDAEGNLDWDVVLGGQKTDDAWGVAPLPDDGVAVLAASASHGSGGTDAWLIGLNSGKNVLWERHYGAELWDRPTGLVRAKPGGFFVVGYTTSKGAGYEDYWVLRLDEEGRLDQ